MTGARTQILRHRDKSGGAGGAQTRAGGAQARAGGAQARAGGAQARAGEAQSQLDSSKRKKTRNI